MFQFLLPARQTEAVFEQEHPSVSYELLESIKEVVDELEGMSPAPQQVDLSLDVVPSAFDRNCFKMKAVLSRLRYSLFHHFGCIFMEALAYPELFVIWPSALEQNIRFFDLWRGLCGWNQLQLETALSYEDE